MSSVPQNSNQKTNRFYKPRKITLGRGICYGISDFIGGGSMTIIGAWMLFFYTTYCGLTAVQGGLIIGLSRIVDAFTTLGMGSLTDHFYKTRLGKRFGRRHFFMLFGSPLLLMYAVLWISGLNFWYYLVSYMAFEIISSAIMIPYETLPNEMTEDYKERTKLSSGRMFISAGATFLATFIPGQLFALLGQDSPLPFLVNGSIFAVVFFVCMFVTTMTTWEKPYDEVVAMESQMQHEKTSAVELLKEYVSTLKNKSFRKHLAIYLFSFTGKDTFNTVFAYFVTFCLGLSATVAANMLSFSIIGLVVVPVAGVLMIKKGPKFLYISGYSIMLAMLAAYLCIFLFKPSSPLVWLVVVSLVYQVGRATLEFTPWNVFPFIPDIDELVSGRNRAGEFAAVMTFCRKSTVAVATIVAGWILDEFGFDGAAKVQTPQAQGAIIAVLVGMTALLLVVALICALTFKVNQSTHDVLIKELNRLKDGGSKADVDPETKLVVEQLAGVPYETMWPVTDTVSVQPRK